MIAKALAGIVFMCGFMSVSSAANTSPDCPPDLEGKWFCHEDGMPGDSSDETTYQLTFEAKFDSAKKLISYLMDAEFGPIYARELPVDATWHFEKVGNSPREGQIYDVNRRYSCENQRLVAESIHFIYKTIADYNHHKVERAQASKQIYSMSNRDNLRIDRANSSSSDVCTRQNR